MNTLPAQFQRLLQQAALHHIRLPVVWQGNEAGLIESTTQILALLEDKKLYWIGRQAPEHAIELNAKQNYQLLGSECDVLVINAFSGFDADLVAASAGCVKAGGLWLLLCPPFAQWQSLPNPAHQKLLPYPYDANHHQGQFISFWLQQLQQQNVLLLSDDQQLQQLQWPVGYQAEAAEAPCVTQNQHTAVAAILAVIKGHRRRPLVISADRGRGKSAALGIAAAKLAGSGKQLIITASSPQAAATAQQHFSQLCAPEYSKSLTFVPFDQLLAGNYSTDLLLVDEAAAIPTPVLQQLVLRFSRIVFATTEHGYEGTGRGFQLRFQQHLDAHCPGWKKLHMHQPIRYQQQDPLEQLIFDGFLLRRSDVMPQYDAEKTLRLRCFRLNDWCLQPAMLQQLFNLLSLAHYQTQVTDLAALLDNPGLTVIALQQEQQLLACALVSAEGGIPHQLSEQIYRGERRLQGHLLAQSLAFHVALPAMATKPLWRIMRIAVQPSLQRQQLGTKLLQAIEDLAVQQNIAYLGTSFGATAELLRFWQSAGYGAIRLGHSTDKASNEHSLLMLKAVLGCKIQVESLTRQFAQQLYHCIGQYPALDASLACSLVQPPDLSELNEAQYDQLRLFSQGKRPYELVWLLLLDWFNHNFEQLAAEETKLLYSLLWQRNSMAMVAQQFALPGKKGVLRKLQNIIAAYIRL